MNAQTIISKLNDLIEEIKDPDGTGEEPEYLDEYDQGKIDGINAAKDLIEEMGR